MKMSRYIAGWCKFGYDAEHGSGRVLRIGFRIFGLMAEVKVG